MKIPKNSTIICAPKHGWFIVKGKEGLEVIIRAVEKAWRSGRCLKIESEGVLFVPDEQIKLLSGSESLTREMVPIGEKNEKSRCPR